MKNAILPSRDRPLRSAYFFLVGRFAFFLTIADCGLGGMASMRRASSSTVIGGSDFLGMVV